MESLKGNKVIVRDKISHSEPKTKISSQKTGENVLVKQHSLDRHKAKDYPATSREKHKKKKKRKDEKRKKKQTELDRSEEELLLIKQQLERELAKEEQLLFEQQIDEESAHFNVEECQDINEFDDTSKPMKKERSDRGDLSLIKNEIAKELERQIELERIDQTRIKEEEEVDIPFTVSDSDEENFVEEVAPETSDDINKSAPYIPADTEPVVTEDEPVRRRGAKTSDTYWNKYADRLGIHIEEPKPDEIDASLDYEPDSCAPPPGHYHKSKDKDTDSSHRRDHTPEKQKHKSRIDVDKSRHDGRKLRQKEDLDSSMSRENRSRRSDKDAKDSCHRTRDESKESPLDRPTENIPRSNEKAVQQKPPIKRKAQLDPILTRTGGAYIPPAKLKMMQEQITDKSSVAFQRLAWEALKKSINGLVNKVNVSNIGIIVRELLQENVVRGRGLLCRALIQAQSFSQTFTHVYAAVVAVINSKFPQIGELLANRLVLNLRRGIKRNDKTNCMGSCRFIAHLINQQVVHEILGLELLFMLLEKAKDNVDETEAGQKSRNSSLELAIEFLKQSGMKLDELSRKSMIFIQDSLRNILHEGKLDSRYKYMAEVMMAEVKDGFKKYPSVESELDLVEPDDQFTHVIQLDSQIEGKDILNVFKHDPDYEENETKYKEIKSSILGDESEGESGSEGDSESGSGSESEEAEEEKKGQQIIDMTEANLLGFRRKVYLTIQSSLDVDETAHKLLKGEIKPEWEKELCNMFIDCCAQQRTYMKFYGLLAQRFCMISNVYREPFQVIFKEAYDTCHRFELEKLRNVAKLFSHLLFSDAISWEVLASIHLNQDETTSSSRVYLSIMFQELADFMGLAKLNERLRDPTLAVFYEGILPRDHPANTRFAINFFTTIGLGGLTDDLREYLRNQAKPTAVVAPIQRKQDGEDSSSSDSSSSGSSSSGDSSSSSDSDSSGNRKKKENKKVSKPSRHSRSPDKHSETVKEGDKRRRLEEVEDRRSSKHLREDQFSRRQREDFRAGSGDRIDKNAERRKRKISERSSCDIKDHRQRKLPKKDKRRGQSEESNSVEKEDQSRRKETRDSGKKRREHSEESSVEREDRRRKKETRDSGKKKKKKDHREESSSVEREEPSRRKESRVSGNMRRDNSEESSIERTEQMRKKDRRNSGKKRRDDSEESSSVERVVRRRRKEHRDSGGRKQYSEERDDHEDRRRSRKEDKNKINRDTRRSSERQSHMNSKDESRHKNEDRNTRDARHSSERETRRLSKNDRRQERYSEEKEGRMSKERRRVK